MFFDDKGKIIKLGRLQNWFSGNSENELYMVSILQGHFVQVDYGFSHGWCFDSIDDITKQNWTLLMYHLHGWTWLYG